MAGNPSIPSFTDLMEDFTIKEKNILNPKTIFCIKI
jgi:hypothetical protein